MSREARNDTPFVDFPAGATILREGEPASALFIIEAGKVAIERSDAPGVVLAELGPGDFFGEMSILHDAPHAANAVAKTVVRALRVDIAGFHAVLRENVEVSLQLMRRLVQRLRASDTRRVELEAQLARSLGTPHAAAPAAAAPPPASAPPAAVKPASAPVKAEPVKAEPVKATPPAVAPPVAVLAPVAPIPATAAPAPTVPVARAWVLRHADGVIALPEGKTDCLVGRPDPATGAIPEINLGPLDLARSLSRRHARLLVGASGVSLREEPGVANGTWVNGERVAAGAAVALKAGDKLRFGAIELELGTA